MSFSNLIVLIYNIAFFWSTYSKTLRLCYRFGPLWVPLPQSTLRHHELRAKNARLRRFFLTSLVWSTTAMSVMMLMGVRRLSHCFPPTLFIPSAQWCTLVFQITIVNLGDCNIVVWVLVRGWHHGHIISTCVVALVMRRASYGNYTKAREGHITE